MKRSMLTALAGGLITGTGTFGLETALNTAEASPITTSQTRTFELRLDGTALTCCYDAGAVVGDFVFDGFDPVLGQLNTATLDIDIGGLLADVNSLTCCYDFGDVVAFGGTLLGEDISEGLVRDLADGTARVLLDPALIGRGPVPVAFDFQFEFAARTVVADPNAVPGGSLVLSYTFTPPAVPEPATLGLGAAGLFSAFAAGARRRRRDGGR
ncbi:MAG: PEP-CTERM sorting domain-containing protein [Gammaproteobacteria bacterium]|nr:PEP-CTERM sorting domain-containing protein [Gammaproteobacteria bacterium]MCP5202155.1 PEP-CTERM sorting domain-containing protein [Gammaproteobacteria bacterium]